ncbi:MAG: hypothetical protein NT129_05840 [Candidatus Aenigmarchaeota archaeon]|nr:hypothetical protein [Candidatus Aenigmarchaeota archaeon]
MKKILILFAMLILASSIALADNQGVGQGSGQGPGTTILNQSGGSGQWNNQSQQSNESGQVQQETENQGEDQNLMIQQRERTMAHNASELGQMIQQRQQEMNQEMQGLGEGQQKIYQNQNRVRVAVHALLAMENLTGGIGRNISQIAREFNNSVQATIRAEEKIQTRNFIFSFFFGGDEQSAGEMEQEVNRNRERIQELKQLMNQCSCSDEVKAMMQEQIQNMEQEQNRLQEMSQEQLKSKGLLGWLWK